MASPASFPLRLARPLGLLMLLGLLAACNGDPAKIVAEVAPQVVDQLPGDVSGIVDEDEAPLGHVDVYVDLSYSMQPYLSGGDTTPFHRFLNGLHNNLGGDLVSFSGFGFERGADVQRVAPLTIGEALAASSYVLLNNDYEDLLARFGGLDTTRLVVTDGVQSDPEAGARFGGIVAEARRWIEGGGAFAALLYRSPYRGTYYPEAAVCTASRVHFECPDRPFVVLAFAPSAGALDRLLAVIKSVVPSEHVVRIGGSAGLGLSLVAEADPPEGQRRRQRLIREPRTVRVPRFQPVEWGRVDTRAVGEDGFLPLQFDVRLAGGEALWQQMGPEEQERFITGLRPRLRAWSFDSKPRGGEGIGIDSVGVFQDLGGSRVAWQPDPADSTLVARLTVPVQRPEPARTRERHVAWVLTLEPFENLGGLVPAGYSTEVDCTNETCAQTLNLAPLLGAILRDLYLPGRQLFVTEWRG